MALSKSMQKAQIPLPCELCEIETKIQWKCTDCNLLLCDKCKNKVHSKFKKAKDHKIITIKEIGLQGDNSGQTLDFSDIPSKDQDKQIRIKAIKEYTTELSLLTNILQCNENTFWIHSCHDPKIIQKVTLQPDSSLKVLQELKDYAECISLTRNGDLLLSDLTSNLKILKGNEKKLTISKYNFKSYDIDAIHVNKENQLIVGAVKKYPIDYLVSGGGVVMVMDMDGNHQAMYEFDKNNEPLFTDPIHITTTKNGNIFIIDITTEDYRGRVVTLEKGSVSNIYQGHPDINSNNHPFKPCSIGGTPNDNVIVSDMINNTLHFLDHSGDLLAYCNTVEDDILLPYSMICSKPGKLFIGSAIPLIGNHKANIFEVEIPNHL